MQKGDGCVYYTHFTDYNRKKNFAKGLYKPSELVYNHAIDADMCFSSNWFPISIGFNGARR